VCDQKTSKTRRLKSAAALWKIQPQWVVTAGKQTIIDVYLVKKFAPFYGNRGPITFVTKSRYLYRSRTSQIQNKPLFFFFEIRFNFILPSTLRFPMCSLPYIQQHKLHYKLIKRNVENPKKEQDKNGSYHFVVAFDDDQWRTGGGGWFGGYNPLPPKFRSFTKSNRIVN
jgi:hypothetical protein